MADINECEQADQADCDDERRANCINTDGGYMCQCIEPQYTGDGKFCTGNCIIHYKTHKCYNKTGYGMMPQRLQSYKQL